MKKYKVIKAFPGVMEGTVFTFDDDGYYAEQYYFVKSVVENSPEFFEEVKETKSIYDLREGDEYFIVTHYSEVEKKEILRGLSVDLTYNTFLTKEEAEKELAKRKAIAKIKKWSWENDKGYEWTEGEENIFIHLGCISGQLTLTAACDGKTGIQIYYSTEEKAKQAILELETEYKILFDID